MTLQDDTLIRGGRELDTLLQTLPAKVERNILRTALRAGAAVMLAEVKQNIPVSSGDLRKTARISSRVKGGEVTVAVKVGGKYRGVDAWYARLVEYGTRPHLVKVSDSERGVNKKTGKLVSMGTVNRRVMQIGGTFVGPVVSHPGAQARPFMRPAVDVALPRALDAVTTKIRQRLTQEGINSQPLLPMDGDE